MLQLMKCIVLDFCIMFHSKAETCFERCLQKFFFFIRKATDFMHFKTFSIRNNDFYMVFVCIMSIEVFDINALKSGYQINQSIYEDKIESDK